MTIRRVDVPWSWTGPATTIYNEVYDDPDGDYILMSVKDAECLSFVASHSRSYSAILQELLCVLAEYASEEEDDE